MYREDYSFRFVIVDLKKKEKNKWICVYFDWWYLVCTLNTRRFLLNEFINCVICTVEISQILSVLFILVAICRWIFNKRKAGQLLSVQELATWPFLCRKSSAELVEKRSPACARKESILPRFFPLNYFAKIRLKLKNSQRERDWKIYIYKIENFQFLSLLSSVLVNVIVVIEISFSLIFNKTWFTVYSTRDEYDGVFISAVEISLQSILERERERDSRASKYTRGNLLAFFNEG